MDDFLVSKTISSGGGQELITVSTVDRRKCPLTGEIRIQPISSSANANDHATNNANTSTLVLVHFRKSKGDPLEFKRLFQAIRAELTDLVLRDQAVEQYVQQPHPVSGISAEDEEDAGMDALML